MRSYCFKGMLILAAAFFMLASASGGAAEQADSKDTVDKPADYVAVVNGEKISRQELSQKVDMMKARFSSRGMPLQGKRLAQLRQTILENLIEKELLYQESKAQGIEVDPAQVDKQIKDLKAQFENEQAFEKRIAAINYTEEDLREQIRENLAIRKLIDQKVASGVSVSDAEVKSYYKKNKKEFETPEKVHARHILIESGPDASKQEKKKAREELAEVRKKIKNGADFSEMAKKHSEGPSKKSGGDLGYFSHGQMVENFDKAAFALKPGEISDIVETRFGYHLIKVEDRKPADTKSLDEVQASIREQLHREKVIQKLEPYIESLKQKYPVEKNLPEADQG